MKSNGRWKAIEREFAEEIGGVRVPINGRIRGSARDIENEIWAVEVKAGKTAASKIPVAIDQARACTEGTDKIPLVLIYKSTQGKKALKFAVIPFPEFLEVNDLLTQLLKSEM